MNLKSIVFALMPAAFMLLLLSCGGTVSTPLTPEEALTKRAESYNLTFDRQDWLEQYKYLSPRTREVCKNGEYALRSELGWVVIEGLLGISGDEKLTSSVLRVTVDGDTGRVFSDLKLDGELVEFGGEDKGDVWVHVDGEWWHEEADWETTCELW